MGTLAPLAQRLAQRRAGNRHNCPDRREALRPTCPSAQAERQRREARVRLPPPQLPSQSHRLPAPQGPTFNPWPARVPPRGPLGNLDNDTPSQSLLDSVSMSAAH